LTGHFFFENVWSAKPMTWRNESNHSQGCSLSELDRDFNQRRQDTHDRGHPKSPMLSCGADSAMAQEAPHIEWTNTKTSSP
jgi:hypothetical protein